MLAPDPKPLSGIALKITSVVAFTLMAALIKAAGRVPAGEIVFFRSFFAIFPIVIYLIYTGTFSTALKTSDPFDSRTGELKEGYVDGYSNQLDAYKLALEKPAKGEPKKVTWLGLITLTPRALTLTANGVRGLSAERECGDRLSVELRILPLACSRAREAAMLSQIAELLDHPPSDRDDCRYCQLRRTELSSVDPQEGLLSGLLSL